MQEAAIIGSTSPIEAYSSDLYVLDPVEDSQQVACMPTDDWHQAQWADLVFGLIIERLQEGDLGQCQLKAADPPELQLPQVEARHSV